VRESDDAKVAEAKFSTKIMHAMRKYTYISSARPLLFLPYFPPPFLLVLFSFRSFSSSRELYKGRPVVALFE